MFIRRKVDTHDNLKKMKTRHFREATRRIVASKVKSQRVDVLIKQGAQARGNIVIDFFICSYIKVSRNFVVITQLKILEKFTKKSSYPCLKIYFIPHTILTYLQINRLISQLANRKICHIKTQVMKITILLTTRGMRLWRKLIG